jgi:hypothetical protein
MITLHAEHVARRRTRCRQLPAAAVRELEACAGVGAGARAYVPLVGDCHRLREIQRHRPIAQCSGTGVGDRHVQLEGSAAGAGRRGRTAVRCECLVAQHKAGQQQAKSQKSFHCIYPLFKVVVVMSWH